MAVTTAASRGRALVTTAGQRPGLSSLLVQRRLRRVTRSGVVLGTSGAVRSLRVLPSGLDTELSHAVDVAATQQRPLIAVLPLPLPAAPMAMAAAVTIAAIAAARRVQARTAVVCPRLAGRQVYEELLVERERLSVLVPRALVGEASTSSTVVTAHDCAQLLAAESLDALTGLVLDLGAVEPGDLARVLKHVQHRSPRRPLLLLAIASSPLDPAVAAVHRANGLVYAVDQHALAELASATPPAGPGDGASLVCDAAALARAGAASLLVRDCGDMAMDRATAAMWTAITALSKTSAANSWQAANLRWAWAVTSSFTLLATSATRVDHSAFRGPWGPPVLGEASQRARDLAVSENESWWLRWAEAVDAAVEASGGERKAAVVAQIAAGCDPGRQVVCLTRNRASATALRVALLEDPKAPADVQVASMRDFAASRVRVSDDALVVITGPLPRQYAAWLCVPPAGGLVVLTAGPSQTQRAARQAIDSRAALLRARHSAASDGLEARSSPPPGEMSSRGPLAVVSVGGQLTSFETAQGRWDEQARGQLDTRRRSAIADDLPADTSGEESLWSPFRSDVLAVLERSVGRVAGASDQMFENDAEGGAGAAGSATFLASGPSVVVLPVTLRPLDGGGDRILLHPPGAVITRRDGPRVKSVAARALRPGDLVALVDGQARQDIFEYMVEMLEESAQWELLVRLARDWQECVQRIPGSGLSYEEVRQRSGVSVQAKTIGTWVRGRAVCPLDPEDVRRLARALDDDKVLSRADAVAAALLGLWRMHQRAGRWLSAKLAYASRVGLGDDALRGRIEDEMLDPALGLRASDLLGSVRLYQVTQVGPACHAPSGAAGIPIAPDEAVGLCSPLTGDASAALAATGTGG